MIEKTIAILGGGVGGIVTANELRRLLPRSHRVMVIERNELHAFAPSFLWLMVGKRTRSAISRPLRRLLAPDVELRTAEVRSVDTAGRRLNAGSDVIEYDYLVIATGAELAPEATPGLVQSDTFFTLDGAERLHERLRSFGGGSVAVVVAALPYKCPGAPCEGAMLIADFLRSRGIAADIRLYTPEPQPMPVAGPALGAAVLQMLRDRSIAYHPQHTLRSVEQGSLTFADRDAVGADLIISIPAHRASAVLRSAGLTNEGGWIPAEPRSLATTHENVFAIGDCAAIPLPGRWKPEVPLMLPKAGVFAHAQGIVVARRIAAMIRGTEPQLTFGGEGFCMLEAGEGLAGFAYGDFFSAPAPDVRLRRIGRRWHAAKVVLEQWWMSGSGPRQAALGFLLRGGAQMLRVPFAL